MLQQKPETNAIERQAKWVEEILQGNGDKQEVQYELRTNL